MRTRKVPDGLIGFQELVVAVRIGGLYNIKKFTEHRLVWARISKYLRAIQEVVSIVRKSKTHLAWDRIVNSVSKCSGPCRKHMRCDRCLALSICILGDKGPRSRLWELHFDILSNQLSPLPICRRDFRKLIVNTRAAVKAVEKFWASLR